MDSEEIVTFEQTSLDYAQQLADIQEDLLAFEPNQIDDYVNNIIESPMMEKENRIIYLSKVFIQSAKNRPLNIENLALFTKSFVDKLFQTSEEKANSFISALLSQLRNPFELDDAGCFFFRHLIKNEVISIAELFNEIDSIDINQKILDEISFQPASFSERQKKELDEENENYELHKVFGFITSSSILNVDKIVVTEQILIKSKLMKWLADYFYGEFPGTVIQYIQSMNISFPLELDEYKVQANNGVNNDPLYQIIRNDDIDTLKQIVTNDIHFDLNQKIKFSRFERNSEINNNTTLIEYATYYNSMKIFKYIFLNVEKNELIKKNPNIEQKAILGSNIECVRLLDQHHFITKQSLIYSIISFATDIFIWLYQNKYPQNYFKQIDNISLTSQIFDSCIKNENIQILLFLLLDEEFDVNFRNDEGNSLLYICAKYDKRLIARFLMLNENFKVTAVYFVNVIKAAISFNHPQMFSFLLKMGEKSLTHYFSNIFSFIYSENQTSCFELALKILPDASIRRDKQLFDFLEKNYTSEKIINFLNNNPLYSIFFNPCTLKNLYVRKDFKTFLSIIDKAYHDRESTIKLKYSINIQNDIKALDLIIKSLKEFDIPHYKINDKFNESGFELVIGEVISNTCIQFYNQITPKFEVLI